VTSILFQLTGGIGLFLLGMVLLTDGLKAFAGEALRRALVRFTGTPWKAFGSGALVTALVQSSSATTVTVIGFVSAGLLTFPQALGVVFGASLGTTGTGWIVSVLGLTVSVGLYALPLVGIGAFVKLLARGRWRSLGLALAGFGLIFVGIETLQTGMKGLAGLIQLSTLPQSGLPGHLLALLVGLAMTLILQSSSAAVATTLTALHADAVNFEQAAVVLIGAAVGTTVTGALAAIGGSVPAKRTALAHVMFNAATGLIAVLLLPVLLAGIGLAQQHLGLQAGATSLAAFHTLFIAVGVAVFLPFAEEFTRLIERMVPDRGPMLTRHLDSTLLQAPAVALEATRRSLLGIAFELFALMHARLESPDRAEALGHGDVAEALDRTQQFLATIPPVRDEEPLSRMRVAQMHALDHLARLHLKLHPPPGVRRMLAHPRLKNAVGSSRRMLALGQAGMRGRATADWLGHVGQDAAGLTTLYHQERPAVLRETAAGTWSPNAALEVLDAMRYLERVGYHTWRICHYLIANRAPEVPLVPDEDGEPYDSIA
jgi:phosphate:Na+ symporter